MRGDAGASFGAAAAAAAVALFLAAALVIGEPPAFDARGTEFAAFYEERQTRIQVACALNAVSGLMLVWFLATVASLTAAPGARRASVAAFGCGLVFVALFLVDNTALAVGALRPENMAADPELASALHDLEWLTQGMAAPLGAGMLAAYALLALREREIWPSWLGWLALLAAVAYLLRLGILFTTDGPFAGDGAIGLYLPVASIGAWLLLASVVLTLGRRESPWSQRLAGSR